MDALAPKRGGKRQRMLLLCGLAVVLSLSILLDLRLKMPLLMPEMHQTTTSTATTISTQALEATLQTSEAAASRKPALFLIGERHSGTNWITRHLVDCFGNRTNVSVTYGTWKHWFQSPEYVQDRPVNSSVVVAQFRHPYTWTVAMRNYPHHAPLHFNLPLPKFVTKPWTMDRYDEDLAYDNNNNATQNHHHDDTNLTCRQDPLKHPHELIPCLAKHNQDRGLPTFYELRNDGSGTPYRNVLDLRRDKIRNFLSVQHYPDVKAFHAVRYEDLFFGNGTASLLQQLERDLGVPANCTPLLGRKRIRTGFRKEYEGLMKALVDWETEALLGYTPHKTSWETPKRHLTHRTPKSALYRRVVERAKQS